MLSFPFHLLHHLLGSEALLGLEEERGQPRGADFQERTCSVAVVPPLFSWRTLYLDRKQLVLKHLLS